MKLCVETQKATNWHREQKKKSFIENQCMPFYVLSTLQVVFSLFIYLSARTYFSVCVCVCSPMLCINDEIALQ